MKQPKSDHKLSRRVLFAGVGTAGAVAAVATVLPPGAAPAPVAEAPRQPPERGGGYQLSEHVKHYYRSARI